MATLSTFSLGYLLQTIIPVFALIGLTIGCTPLNYEPSLEQKIFMSDVILYGKVLRHYRDDVRHRYESAFIAELEVFCSFKGGRFQKKVNITGAGHVPGLCVSTRFDIGQIFLVLLDKNGKYLEPQNAEIRMDPNINKDMQTMDDIMSNCNLDSQYPYGVEETTATYECPETAGDEDCIRYTPPPVRTEPPIRIPTLGPVAEPTRPNEIVPQIDIPVGNPESEIPASPGDKMKPGRDIDGDDSKEDGSDTEPEEASSKDENSGILNTPSIALCIILILTVLCH